MIDDITNLGMEFGEWADVMVTDTVYRVVQMSYLTIFQ